MFCKGGGETSDSRRKQHLRPPSDRARPEKMTGTTNRKCSHPKTNGGKEIMVSVEKEEDLMDINRNLVQRKPTKGSFTYFGFSPQ